MNDDPIKRCTRLILFQAQSDHATQLVIRSSPSSGAAIRYQVNQNWYDWRSPGPDQASAIIDEIARLAGLRKSPFTKQGLIDLAYSGLRLLWVVKLSRGEGECVLSPLEQ